MSSIYVVKGGDCLYSIGGASWQRIYECNKDVIGSDAGLIRPGQKLKLPPCKPVLLPEQLSSAEDVSGQDVAWDLLSGAGSCELWPVSQFTSVDDYLPPAENDLQIYEPTVWSSADVERLFSSKWYLDQLRQDKMDRLFKLAEDDSFVGRKAIAALEEMARNGELTAADLEKAAVHKEPCVRRIAANNALTPTDVLFTLVEKDFRGWGRSIVGSDALENLRSRANDGKLTVEDIEKAATHSNPYVRMIAVGSA